jgi:serine/threonine protein kinase
MPVRIEPHSEPIPGYRLIERLGGGGFGEVWKCEAPGGLYKAIKFVYGDMDALDGEDGSRAEQELKALKRVKTVHHPYILSLERFDIVDGQLMIVMELADRTLWDRFRECRTQGLPGIPRTELLGYLRETAEALDLMNDQFQLQHLDIKPQNLFLVFNHIKVADFGLVKDLGNKAAATITGGVTPVYAAPETFDGWLSRFSDQYSLAIVYQELLTGVRPFTGATMRQLVLQHLQGTPDLNSLPAADRPIVARALSKNPDGRYPNCLEFLRELEAISPRPPSAIDVDLSTPAVPDAPGPQSGAESHAAVTSRDENVTRKARGKNGLVPSELERFMSSGPAQVLPPRPDRVDAGGADGGSPEATADSFGDTPPTSGRATIAAVRRSPSASDMEITGTGPVQPALVIGLGGLGGRALGQLRRRLTVELGRPDEVPLIRLLVLDTDPDALQALQTGDPGQVLRLGEILPTKLHRPSYYLKPRDSKGSGASVSWLSSKLFYRIPRDQTSAGLRPLGRLAFVDNYRMIWRRLDAELRACTQALGRPPAREGLGPRGAVPRVYIVTCLAGNTGSGMFLDVAYAVRQQLRRQGHADAEIIGLFFLPDAAARSIGLANAYASLTEMSHFCQHPFAARYEAEDPLDSSPTLTENSPPFARCLLLGLPGQATGEIEAATTQTVAMAGELLYRDLATAVGITADDIRARTLRVRSREGAKPQASSMPQGPTFHVAGTSRVTWPRQPMLERGARRFCRRLVDSWMTKNAKPIVKAIADWTAEKWDALGLRSEALISRVHEMCEKIVKQAPDKLVTAITGPLGDAMTPPPDVPGASVPLGPAVAALAELDQLLGVQEECRSPNQAPPPPGILETALAEATAKLAETFEQRLAEHVVRLIEDPRYRLAGAEEALRQLSAATERALASQETLARELHDQAVLLYQKIQKTFESPAITSASTKASGWKIPFRRTPAPNSGPAAGAMELVDLIRKYPKARYHGLVLHHINRFYVGLRGQLSDQLREIGFCRQRLGELANLLQPGAPAAETDLAPTGRVLLPANCKTLDEVLEQLEKGLTDEDRLTVDQQIESLIRQNFRALVNVCMGSSAMVRALAPIMLAHVKEFLTPRFGGPSVAGLLLRRGAEENEQARAEDAVTELHEIFERAAPKNAPPLPDAQFATAMLPNDVEGLQLETLLRVDLADVTLITADLPDEIVFYREQIYLGPAALEQLGPAAQDAYRQRLATDPISLHTREDVPEWQPLRFDGPVSPARAQASL